MSDEHKEAIRIGRVAGETATSIARRIGYSAGSVRWFCLMEGIEPPRPVVRANPRDLQVHRNGRVMRRFTPEEDRKIIQMRLEQTSLAAIGRALGRGHNSIVGRLATLARYDALAEGSGI